MLKRAMNIADFDPELAKAIQDENQRQEHHIELIASENYCSPRVLEAQGSQLTSMTSRLQEEGSIIVNKDLKHQFYTS